MDKPIIEVKGLSKKYRISHQRYLALRDTLAAWLKKPLDLLKPKKQGFPLKEDFWALKDISFNVSQGEVIGIIGRNGAGKTTLLKVLSRITHPTEGEVRLRGRVGSLLEVGTGFHPELTGRENIYFNGSILGMKKREIEKKFNEIVEFSGVEKFLDTPVKRFSSGMQVRLAFSVAAYLEPEILLVDEVLAVGDAEFQKKCLGKMKDVSSSGRTVLFVSHNMTAIRNLCKRTILLEAGKLSLDTDTERVVSNYLSQNLTIDTSISGKELEARLEGVINRRSPSVRFQEVAILNGQNLPCRTFDSNGPIIVSIVYECLDTVNDLRLNIYIVDEENRVILATQNLDDQGEAVFYKRDPGIYRSVCTIAPNIFGEKRFFLSVHLEYPKVEHLVLDRVLGFDVIFRGYNDNLLASLKDSFIRPKLEWDTAFIGNKNRGE